MTRIFVNISHHVDKYMFNNVTFFLPERSRSGNKTKFFEGDIILSKSVEETIENRKRGAASNVPTHIWPIKNGKHEIPYQIDSGKKKFKNFVVRKISKLYPGL